MSDLESESKLDDEVIVLLRFSKGANMRNKIMEILQSGFKNCNQISKELSSDWWTVQKHLQRLLKAGLVKHANFGRIKFYKITPKGKVAWSSFANLKKPIGLRQTKEGL